MYEGLQQRQEFAAIADATAARSIPANLALAESNASLAAAIAVAAAEREVTAR